LKRDLHVDPVGIVDVQAMIGIVTDTASALGQIACGGFLGETGYANREVIDNFGRALTVQRDQSPVRTETNDSERLVLADDGEVEHFLIEVDGTLQVRVHREERNEQKGTNEYRSEFRYGEFVRALPLPPGVKEEDIKASYKDGILEIRVPIGAETESSVKRIPVARG